MATTRAPRSLALGGALPAPGTPVPTAANGAPTDITTTVTTATGQAREGSPTSAVDRVSDLYGAYIDALYDSGRGRLTDTLRAHYLTPKLRQRLTRWEAAHPQDGVLRAKGVPTAWKVVYNDSGMGHCWTRVTLTWQDSASRVRHTHLMVQSDLETRLISGIRTA
jgi:hypothetical protein